MKELNSYIQEKLYIGKGFSSLVEVDDIYNHLLIRYDSADIKKKIKEWVEKYNVTKVKYISTDDSWPNMKLRQKEFDKEISDINMCDKNDPEYHNIFSQNDTTIDCAIEDVFIRAKKESMMVTHNGMIIGVLNETNK